MSNSLETLNLHELNQRRKYLQYQLERVDNQIEKISKNQIDFIYDTIEYDSENNVKKIILKVNKNNHLPIQEESKNQELKQKKEQRIKISINKK